MGLQQFTIVLMPPCLQGQETEQQQNTGRPDKESSRHDASQKHISAPVQRFLPEHQPQRKCGKEQKWNIRKDLVEKLQQERAEGKQGNQENGFTSSEAGSHQQVETH